MSVPCGADGCHGETHVFVPDPDRFAIIGIFVTGDWHTIFNVLGWRYCSDTNTSEPVVSTRVAGCASLRTWHTDRDRFILAKQWTGITFGHHGEIDSGRDAAPTGIHERVNHAILRYQAIVEAEMAEYE